ncbi:hypothetical protein [Maliponia aquimaris]|uniref:Uncharacterized protein n=1 Tax=Maliponia aquimaris TaxID=1673631 RepID=A0A238KMQ6_9RHOB|nr:hypothetical protein [Maliponia aquimaris]SMX43988.1 hypothetical protein MAA8898_02957 [Maliponia aquimaris]
MNIPEWLKPGIYGALVGAAFVGIAGFSWGGWVTGGTAHDQAVAMSRQDVVTAMVPVCLDMARVDPGRVAALKSIRDAQSYKRRDALMATGWATMPGSDAPNRDIAQACLASLDVDTVVTEAEAPVDGG